jgi:hypothetical protein
MLSPIVARNVSVQVVEASGAISPANAASPSFTLLYDPPTVALSSNRGVNGSQFDASSIVFRATFSKPVTGVAATDFVMTASAGLTLSSALVFGNGTVFDVGVNVTGASVTRGNITVQVRLLTRL